MGAKIFHFHRVVFVILDFEEGGQEILKNKVIKTSKFLNVTFS